MAAYLSISSPTDVRNGLYPVPMPFTLGGGFVGTIVALRTEQATRTILPPLKLGMEVFSMQGGAFAQYAGRVCTVRRRARVPGSAVARRSMSARRRAYDYTRNHCYVPHEGKLYGQERGLGTGEIRWGRCWVAARPG
jgi:hypothetical protein